jgi:Gpi18-like mannosyltransferase
MTRRQAWMYALGFFIIHSLLVAGASFWFVRQVTPTSTAAELLRFALIKNFVRWDSIWYLRIAHHGYRSIQDSAFFPLYPYSIRGLSSLTGLSYEVCGLLISNLSFLLALYWLVRLLAMDHSPGIVRCALWLLIAFPTSFFFSAVYTESLFLLWSVGCFYLLRLQEWWWAGAFGFLAALTRNTGVLLVLPFLWESTWNPGLKSHGVGRRSLAAAMIPAGLGVDMVLLYRQIGDPLGFIHAQSFWSRAFQWPWLTVCQGTIATLQKSRHWIRPGNPIFETVVVWWEMVLVALSLWSPSLRIRWSYWLYGAASICIPLLSPSTINIFLSIPRFALAIFPLFLIGALVLNQKRWLILILALGMTLQSFLIYNLTRGKFVP